MDDDILYQLSDEVVARIFFMKLWQRYDASGINFGRSLQSNLLDHYLDLCPCEVPCSDTWRIGRIVDQAARRQSIEYKQIVLGNGCYLSLIPSHTIGLLCIEALRIWYKVRQGVEDRDGVAADSFEYIGIEMACSIMPIPYAPFLKTPNDLSQIEHVACERVRIQKQYDRPELI